MDKATEIRKFQALLQYSAISGEDVSRELWTQKDILRSLKSLTVKLTTLSMIATAGLPKRF